MIRVGSFCLALIIGIQAAILVTSVVTQLTMPVEIQIAEANGREERFAKTSVGVRIYYIGLTSSTSDFGSTMRFLIVNGSSETIKCIGYSGVCAGPTILIRGHDAGAWVCMNGSSKYSIKPGETAELMISPQDFATLPNRSEKVAIGYEFDHLNGESTQYLAEPMILPTEFRKELKRELDGRRSE